jgi:hypothetical protein
MRVLRDRVGSIAVVAIIMEMIVIVVESWGATIWATGTEMHTNGVHRVRERGNQSDCYHTAMIHTSAVHTVRDCSNCCVVAFPHRCLPVHRHFVYFHARVSIGLSYE